MYIKTDLVDKMLLQSENLEKARHMLNSTLAREKVNCLQKEYKSIVKLSDITSSCVDLT